MNDDQVTEPVAIILARMEVKLDHALASVTDHETRLRMLEKKVWQAAAAVSFPIALLVGGATTLINQALIGG